MFSRLLSATTVALAATQLASAQTSTKCDPRQKICPDNAALGKTVTVDFTKGKNDVFSALDGTSIKFDDSLGAVFTIDKETDAPTIQTGKYIFFGKIDVTLRACTGTGVVTSFVLQSDDLDEIDLEWLGGDDAQVQTNYFGKGDTTTYDRGAYHNVANPQSAFHTYTIDWTKDYVKWYIDGNLVRTLNYGDAKGGSRFPQTPMQVKLGTWVAGRKDAPEGTVKWAGGKTNFDNAPFTAYYKSITIQDYGNGVKGASKYSYGDKSGSYESIKILTGDGSDNSSDNDSSNTTSDKPKSTKSGDSSSSKTALETVTGSNTAPLTQATEGSDVRDNSTATTTSTGSRATGSRSATSAGAASTSSGAPKTNGAFKQGLELGSTIVMGAGLLLGFLAL